MIDRGRLDHDIGNLVSQEIEILKCAASHALGYYTLSYSDATPFFHRLPISVHVDKLTARGLLRRTGSQKRGDTCEEWYAITKEGRMAAARPRDLLLP